MYQKLSKNYLLFISVTLMLVLLGTGFVAEAETITVTDSDGYNVEIELPVNKIVCLSSSLNELLVALGAEDKIIGRDDWSDIPAVLQCLQGVPIVASSSYRPQIEAILELNPDSYSCRYHAAG